MRHRGDAVLAEQLRKQSHRHLAVFQHVAHAAGHAQVVFEHVVLAVALRIGGAHDVDAADLRVIGARHVHAHHFRSKLAVLKDLRSRHDARFDDLLVVVNVVQKAVQSSHALHQSAL